MSNSMSFVCLDFRRRDGAPFGVGEEFDLDRQCENATFCADQMYVGSIAWLNACAWQRECRFTECMCVHCTATPGRAFFNQMSVRVNGCSFHVLPRCVFVFDPKRFGAIDSYD